MATMRQEQQQDNTLQDNTLMWTAVIFLASSVLSYAGYATHIQKNDQMSNRPSLAAQILADGKLK